MNPIFLILILVVFYVVVMIPQNRRRKQTQAMQRSIEPGARIVTTSGMYGTVVDVDDDGFVLEIDDDVQGKFVKGALGRVLPDTVATVDTVDEIDTTNEVDAEHADAAAEGTEARATTPAVPGPDGGAAVEQGAVEHAELPADWPVDAQTTRGHDTAR